MQNKKMIRQILNWHRRLSIVKKIGLWGSICSIVSAVALLFPQASISENQTSYGTNSPNIRSNGDVNIHYNSSPRGESYNYIQHPNGGGTILLTTPTLINPDVLCHPEAGSKVQFIKEKAENNYMMWVKVKILTGTCQGKIGWIGKDNYRTHNG